MLIFFKNYNYTFKCNPAHHQDDSSKSQTNGSRARFPYSWIVKHNKIYIRIKFHFHAPELTWSLRYFWASSPYGPFRQTHPYTSILYTDFLVCVFRSASSALGGKDTHQLCSRACATEQRVTAALVAASYLPRLLPHHPAPDRSPTRSGSAMPTVVCYPRW